MFELRREGSEPYRSRQPEVAFHVFPRNGDLTKTFGFLPRDIDRTDVSEFVRVFEQPAQLIGVNDRRDRAISASQIHRLMPRRVDDRRETPSRIVIATSVIPPVQSKPYILRGIYTVTCSTCGRPSRV